MITMPTDDHLSLPSSLRLSRYLTLAFLLFVPLLLFGCPSGTSNKPIEERPSSPSTSNPSSKSEAPFDDGLDVEGPLRLPHPIHRQKGLPILMVTVPLSRSANKLSLAP